MLEKELSVIYTRMRMYEGIYQQALNRIEGMRRRYREFYGNPQPNLIEKDPEYQKAIERMNLAMRHLRALELEKEELMKKVQDLMYRS